MAIVLVGLFTAVLGYGLVNGLNISIVKTIAEKLDVVDVEEPPPPEEPPPTPDLSQAGTPRGNPGSWAGPDDYPTRAMREGREGSTGFRVTYNVEGRITSCDVTSSSGHADLDAETCKLITRRGRFKPGKDRAGNPTGGSYSNRIRWQIPDR